MKPTPLNRSRPACSRRRGVSLIELSMSTAITGILMVGALQAVGQSMLAQRSTADRADGQALADGLLAEIVARAYADPEGGSALGVDAGEAAPRANFDDVDDYRGYSDSPLESRSGATLAGHSGFERQVAVEWVDAATAATAAMTETGVKRITVTVQRGNLVLGRAIALRTNAP